MSKREKRLGRIRQSPNNVSLNDLRSVLEDYGFEFKHTVGSHYTFSYVLGDQTKVFVVPIPASRQTHLRQTCAEFDRRGYRGARADESEESE